MKTIIINGSGGVGKDTFVSLCQDVGKQLIFNISTVDKIKLAAKELGWDGESKTEKDRKFLSDLKDLSEEYNNGPTNYILNKMRYFKKHFAIADVDVIVFIHCREPERIDFLKKELDAKTLLITRPNAAAITSNHADRDVQNYHYDFVIENDGTFDDLSQKAITFLSLI